MSARNTVKSIQDIMRQDVGVDGDAQRLSQLCWMFFLKIIDDQDQQLEMMQDHYRTNLLFFEKGKPTEEIWFYEHRVPEGQKAYSMTRPIKVEHLQGCVDWWGGAERKDRQSTEVAWKVGIAEIKARNYNLDFKNPHTIALAHGDPQELLAKLEQDEQKTASLRDQLKAILAEALLR